MRWSAILLLTSLLSITSTVYAKDEPTIVVKELKNLPNNPNYFRGSDVVMFQEAQSPRTVWRSPDGGATWEEAKGIDHENSIALIMHKYDPDRAYILTVGQEHWKTADKGKTWESFDTGYLISNFPDTFGNWMSFHADDPDKILFTAMNCELGLCEEITLYTTDGFEGKAKVLRTQTQGCWWAKSSPIFTTGEPELDASRIMCIVTSGVFSFQSDNRLLVSDSYFRISDGSDTRDEKEANLNGMQPVRGVAGLRVVKKYMLAATTSPKSAEMALFVTDDTKTWHRAVFPHDHPLTEAAYTVLESTNYSIQIDVRTNKRMSAPPMGTLLTSNSNGTYFTRNIEHTNRNRDGYVDFEKVTGIQGVFLVNQVDNWKALDKGGPEKKIKTSITFDDGRTFQAVKSGDEAIHLHSITEQSNVGPIFSSPAPGLVMGNGNRGKFLKEYEESSLYISDDAGKTWVKGPPGPHKYEFGDQGSILLAIADSKKVNVQEIKYSLDHGETWKTTKLPDDLHVLPLTLTTTQDSTSLKFLLTAQTGTKKSPSFCIVSIDFEGLHEDTCEKDDMEKWSARVEGDDHPSCVMGHTQTFYRRKKDAKCFIKKPFKEPVPQTSPCECTSADFECDFNFAPYDGECQRKGPVLAPEKACKADDPDEKFMGSSGWRLIPGNDCERTKGDQKDDKKEWKCSDIQPGPGGEISVTSNVFKGGFDTFEKHYLERNLNIDDDETIIARPAKMMGGLGDIFVTHDHGKTWATLDGLKGEDIYAIVPHPYAKEMAFFLTLEREVYYTTDRGRTIESFKAPERPDPKSVYSPISFRSNQSDWLIWHGQKCANNNKCYLEASLSTDRGDNWQPLKGYVNRCEFTGYGAYNVSRDNTQILCSARTKESTDIENNPLQLLYTNETAKHDFTVALEHIKEFATMDEFILVATEDTTEGTLTALASLDGTTYSPARFPSNFQVPHQNAYTVLDSSTRAINLFVATEPSESRHRGSILKSTSDGTSYVVSISGVNADDGWYVDFEKMLGLEGVILVNTVANQDSDSEPKNLQTRISHNDGAQWSYLPPPQKDVEGKAYSCSSREGDAICALHLHGYTERADRGKTYSSESAIGLMFGIGNVGPILGDAKEADTFMTQDAGLSWKEVKKGSWAWAYGDQGSIIVLAQREIKTKSISYSLDGGDTWQDKEISESDVIITDITTLRSGSSRNFLLWGHNGKELITVNLDFSGLTDRPCVHDEENPEQSDYELWSPEHPFQPNGCLFGHKNWFLRKKKDRICYNDRPLQQMGDQEDCECTRQDYEW